MVTFHVSYYNGDNKHTTDLVLPLTLGENKMGAQIVVNNIESTSCREHNHPKRRCDQQRADRAKSVLVTVGSPATPVNPNPVYAIGNLEPDDFSSFEVTYTTEGTRQRSRLLSSIRTQTGHVFTEKFTYRSDNATGFGSAAGPSGCHREPHPASSNNRRRRHVRLLWIRI